MALAHRREAQEARGVEGLEGTGIKGHVKFTLNEMRYVFLSGQDSEGGRVYSR